MNSALHPHPDDELLLRLLDGDLGPAESDRLGSHLDGCDSCRQHLGEVRETLDDFQQFHHTILKAAIPPPPQPWEPLDFRSAVIHPRRVLQFPMRAVRWLAAAAAIAAVFLLVRRFEHTPAVKAAELLQRALSAETSGPSRPRTIRISTSRYRLDRAARLTGPAGAPTPDADQIRRLFDSAGYSWDDPLSAGAFVRWRAGLSNIQDDVARHAGTYVVHTTTTAGAIADASLTLRTADLHAISCTLRFASETVEMTELSEDPPQPRVESPAAPEPSAPPAPAPTAIPVRAATPADELLVVAALHRIGADLGEPVEVRREGPDVVVNIAGLQEQRRSEIRTALSGIAAVRFQLEEVQPGGSRDVERRPAPQVDSADPLLSELQAASPDAAEQLTDHTESLIARAYALRGLARRFSPETVARLTPSENASLNRIVRDHADAMAASASAAARLLAPILPPTGTEPAVANFPWQDGAEALVLEARRLDQALHPAAASGDSAGRKLRASQALADIAGRLPVLRKLQ